MAFSLTVINAATNDWSTNKATDIVHREGVLLYRLWGNKGYELTMIKPKDLIDGGAKVREHLIYAKSNTSTYGNSSNVNTSIKDISNAARFAKGGYVASNSISPDEQAENSGAAAMIDLVYAKNESINKTIRDSINTGLYTARSASADQYGLDGLPDLFNTTTSTEYGGIAEDDMPQWKANVDSTAETLSYGVLQSLYRDATVGGDSKGKPNLIVTTDVLRDSFERTMQIQQRFINVDESLTKAGFDNILFKGTPLCADPAQASGVIDCLNTRFLKLRTYREFNFKSDGWQHEIGTPDVLTQSVRWFGALCTNHRAAHARGTGKTAAA